MPSVSVQVDNQNVYQMLLTVDNGLSHAVIDEIQTQMDGAQAEMQQEGAPSTSPVAWDSEKQRRAYFATDGFGAGIPYQRTGTYNASWQTEQRTYAGGGEVRLYTSYEPSIYITGDVLGAHQSRIHRGRWHKFIETVQKYSALIEKSLPDIVDRILRGGAA